MDRKFWEVIGGHATGGIVVREGKELSSKACPQRVSTGSLLEEISFQGDRLQYKLKTGKGPDCGWVSVKTKESELVRRSSKVPPIGAGGKVLLLTVGSRGDVQPLLALGQGLSKAGYAVRVFSAPVQSLGDLHSYGVSMVPEEPDENINWEAVYSFKQEDTGIDPSIWQDMERTDEETMLLLQHSTLPKTLKTVFKEVERNPPDILIHNFLSFAVAHAVREKYGVCTMIVHLQLHSADQKYMWYLLDQNKRITSRIRHLEGVDSMKGMPVGEFASIFWNTKHALFGCSEATLIEEERKALKMFNMTGSWVFEETADAASEPGLFGGPDAFENLRAFLEKGPTVYIGWGSLGEVDPGPWQLVVSAVEALKIAGLRGIICGGWAKLDYEKLLQAHDPSRLDAWLDTMPEDFRSGFKAGMQAFVARHDLGNKGLLSYAQENVLFVSTAPHGWLFERCTATVHHGGAGTVMASLRAGTPMVINPALADQFYFAERIQSLGCGVYGSKLQVINSESLAQSLVEVTTNQEMKQNALALAERIKKEPGVAGAVQQITKVYTSEVQSGKYKKMWESRQSIRQGFIEMEIALSQKKH